MPQELEGRIILNPGPVDIRILPPDEPEIPIRVLTGNDNGVNGIRILDQTPNRMPDIKLYPPIIFSHEDDDATRIVMRRMPTQTRPQTTSNLPLAPYRHTGEPIPRPNAVSLLTETPLSLSNLRIIAPRLLKLLGKNNLAESVRNGVIPAEYRQFLPILASIITSYRDRSQNVWFPDFEDIVQLRPLTGRIRKTLGESKLGTIIENRAVARAESNLLDIANKAIKVTETLGSFENPKDQFYAEIDHLYRYATASYVSGANGFNPPELGPNETQPDKRLLYLLEHIMKTRQDDPINKQIQEMFPLLSLSSAFNNLALEYQLMKNKIEIAAPEIFDGLREFLNENAPAQHAPLREPDSDSMHRSEWVYFKRKIAERKKYRELYMVKPRLKSKLADIYNLIPENGPQFANDIYGTAENVCRLKDRGINDDEIARRLLAIA